MKHHISFDLELRKNPHEGVYIAIEGIDGSGKTTQVEKVAQYFESKGKTLIRTREPRNGGVVGSLIRKILRGELTVPSVALQYLYSADRAIHNVEVIIPALNEGNVVISDRCFWSAIPYGILDRGEDYDFKDAEFLLVTQGILSMYHQFIVPDRTFYLRTSVETAITRLKKEQKSVKEIYEDEGKLRKIVQGYEWLVKKFPEAIMIVDGEQPIEKVTREILLKLPK